MIAKTEEDDILDSAKINHSNPYFLLPNIFGASVINTILVKAVEVAIDNPMPQDIMLDDQVLDNIDYVLSHL